MSKSAPKPRRRGRDEKPAKRDCVFSRFHVEEVDYKDIAVLKPFVSDKGRIRAQRTTGLSRKYQAQVATAVKRAREIGLLKYVGQ
jgi:small subunit ribosomal protein S18